MQVRLRKALERTVRAGHPWIFRDALAPMRAKPGDVVTVLDRSGRFLARGIADAGPIGVRVWTTRDEPVDAALFARRLRDAIALRDRVVPPETDTYRVLHGEGDRVPGIVCDVYGSWAVLAFDGAGAVSLRDVAIEAIRETLAPRGVRGLVVKSGRKGERRVDVAIGTRPDGAIRVRERGMTLLVDLVRGQKTGLFLDHRESRYRVRGLAKGMRVLNLYGYTGGFSVAAGLGGATFVRTVDSAAPAIQLTKETWAANGLDDRAHDAVVADVAAHLEADRESYDLVIADPPSFAPSAKTVPGALDAYGRLHVASLARIAPGGQYLAASCSSHVGRAAFEKTLTLAAKRARRPIEIRERWGAAPDHPTLASFPEGDYLTVCLVRVG